MLRSFSRPSSARSELIVASAVWSRCTTDRPPADPVPPGNTTFVTAFWLIAVPVKARVISSPSGRLVCTLLRNEPTQMSIRLGSFVYSFLNCLSAETISTPWFSERPKSPAGRSWRLRPNASALLPLSRCTPGSKKARDFASFIA